MYINKHKWNEAIVFWDQEIELNNEIDVFYLIHEFKNNRGKNISEHLNFKTILDSDSPEVNFSSSTRRKWKKIIACDYSLKNNFSDNELEETINFYNIFAEKMNLTKITNNIYKKMNEDKKLYISKLYHNGKLAYIHTFYVSKNIARLFHTFPVGEPNRDVNIALHRYELIEFKKFNVNTYDWGGAGFVNEKDEKKLAIREYKRRFGGEEFTYFKARIPGNKKGEDIIKKYYKVI